MRFFIFFLMLFTISAKASGVDSVKNYYTKPSLLFVSKQTRNIDKTKLQKRYKIIEYNSPLYFYKNQIRFTLTSSIKLLVQTNDFSLINNFSKDRMDKYSPKVSATLRIKLPW